MPRFIGNLEHALSRLKSGSPLTQPTRDVHTGPRGANVSPGRMLAPSGVVHGTTNLPNFSTRIAQSQVIFTQPQFYSPLHTPQNWQIPSKRREIYNWCRFFTENEPKVASAIDFLSSFPMNGFELQCDDPKIHRFYSSLVKKLKLEYWSKLISREYHMLGDVFPFAELECPMCHGTGVTKDGQQCPHPHGSFRRIVIMNPDWIDVQTNIMAADPVITLLPDDELKRIVWHKQPKQIYDRIPNHLKALILSGRPIPLNNESVSHLKFNPYPYGVYGTSLIRRLFKILAYKDKIMTAQWIVAERLILPVRIVKVGNDERPAGPAEIADVQQQLAQVSNDPNLTLVTHHAFDYDWVGCLSTDENNSYVLTINGIKHFRDLTENDKIATWNQNTAKVEFQKYTRKVVFSYGPHNSNGIAFRIHTTDWDFLTTPNHRHYLEDGSVKRSDELVEGDILLPQEKWGWTGSIPESLPYKERNELEEFTLEEFCRLAGYYISEGHARSEKTKNLSLEKQIQCFGITQSVGMPKYDDMEYLCRKISDTIWINEDNRSDTPSHTFMIGNADLARWMASQFGKNCYNKQFPEWMLELPTRYLSIMLESLCDGDGNVNRIRYNTTSRILRDQVCNILIKLSKTPRTYEERRPTPVSGEECLVYRISWSQKTSPGRDRSIRKFKVKRIEKIPFDGEMWCLEMPNRNFFVKAGKQIILTGNTNGKVLQLSNEYDFVNKEILQGLMMNEALLSGEMPGYQCHDVDETRTLTKDGFKHYDDITDDDEIGCFNANTGELEYHKPLGRHCYEFDGELIRFQTDRIDIAVTENHRMLFKARGNEEWQVSEARNVGKRAKFRKSVKWSGSEDYAQFIELDDQVLPLRDYLEIAAFYVTEGYVQRETRRHLSTYGDPMSVILYQTEKGKGWDTLVALKERSAVKINQRKESFAICRKPLAAHFYREFGDQSSNKRIPRWIKDLPLKHIEKFLMDLIDGDGGIKTRDGLRYYQYYTKSNQLMNDIMELAIKCGFYPKKKTRRGIWEIYFSEGDLRSNTITLDSKKFDTITRMPYQGRVFCFTTPTGFFITERNGRIAIQGNSAAIGAEAMIQRMESWRRELGQWIEERVFKPVARMKGFIDEEATREYGEDLGEPIFIYPKIKWNELHIRDKSQSDQILLQLQERGLVSAQTVLEKLEYDYDQEVERIRYETAMQSFGQMAPAGAGGAPGGPGGGMGGLGAAPPPVGGLGEPPGGPGGMGGPGGPGGPSADLGGGLGAPAPGGAAAAGMGGSMGKIVPRKRAVKVPEQEEVQPSKIHLTSLEQKLYKSLMGMRLPFPVVAQYPLGPYRTDFAIPNLKLAIEADGDEWHSKEEAVAHDRQRDAQLSYHGWTVARFSESELKERMPDVERTMTMIVNDLWRKALKRQEKMRDMQEASAPQHALVKMALVEDLYRSALNKKEKIANAMKGELTGLIVESLVEEFGDERLRPSGRWGPYAAFRPQTYPQFPGSMEEDDGEANQGTRD